MKEVQAGDLLGDLLVLGPDLLLVDGDLPRSTFLLLDILGVSGCRVGVGGRGAEGSTAVVGAARAVAVLLEEGIQRLVSDDWVDQFLFLRWTWLS